MVVVAGACFFRAGRDRWFVLDEWDFLSSRQDLTLDNVLAPHIGHWVSVPYLVFHALYGIFGLRTYVPYQLVAIAVHLVLAALLRQVMRRAGVGPWLATICAGLLATFGPGNENVLWAFQIGFTLSLAFGVAHLLLADHDGLFDRRDGLALALGALGVMSSLPGVIMVAVVGIAVWIRRGRLAALQHTVPLIGLFAAWLVYDAAAGHEAGAGARSSAGVLAGFVATGYRATFAALGCWTGVGLALAALTLLGLVVSRRLLPGRTWWRAGAGPAALFVGGLLFIASASLDRAAAYGIDYAAQSRYLYALAAFSLPLVAFAAQAVVTRWPGASAPVVLLLLLGVPGNVGAMSNPIPDQSSQRDILLAVPRVPVAAVAPADAVPDTAYEPVDVTVGFLRTALAEGRLPDAGPLDPATAAIASARIALGPRKEAPDRPCQPLVAPVDLQLRQGDELQLGDRPVPITLETPAPPQTAIVDPARGGTLRVQVPSVRVTVPDADAGELRVCR